jgi:hypothetical protein
MIHSPKKFFLQKMSRTNFAIFLFGTLSLLALAWLGDQSYFWVYGKPDYMPSALIGSLVVFLLGSFITAFFAFDFVKVRDLSTKENTQPAEVLIMAVSPLQRFKIANDDGVFKLFKSTPAEGTTQWTSVLTFTGNLDADIAALDAHKLNWQQQLRALRPHKGTIQKVVLVASEEVRSYKFDNGKTHLATLMEWLALYGQDPHAPDVQFTVRACTHSVNKDKMGDYYEAFDHEIDQAVLTHDNKKVVIDVTGGQAVASIGGSLATLHNNCVMQYVNNNGEVKYYDAYIKQVTPTT